MRKRKTTLYDKESECSIRGYFHRYEIFEEYSDGVVEKCSLCNKRIFIKVLEGRIDNVKYVKTHNRQLLQPSHKRFSKEYPESKYAQC